jgi:hypothetical protein
VDPCPVFVLPDDVPTVFAHGVLVALTLRPAAPVHHARIPDDDAAARAAIAFPSFAPDE